MSKHFAKAVWNGNLKEGNGKYKLSSNGFEDTYTFNSRFGDEKKSSPEELIGAALAGCFSMSLANRLDKEGGKVDSVETHAEVSVVKTAEGYQITEILLKTRGKVSGIEQGKFIEIAEVAKANCPVSRALGGVAIEMEAELL